MAKPKKNNKTPSFFIQALERLTTPKCLFFLGTVFFVFFIYAFSLFRPWLPYDERLFFNEELFPIPTRFSEISEIISAFVSNYHVESMNSFFSNYSTVRSNPIASMLIVFVSFFFKKSAFLYHFLQLSIHLINSALIWLIFFKVSDLFDNKSPISNFKLLLISLITSIWAIHSANSEAILLTTNWTTLLTYSFCLLFILYEIKNVQKKHCFKLMGFVLISFLFFALMNLTEYGYTLPLIVFFIVLAFSYKQLSNFKAAFSFSFVRALPYFTGLFVFLIISLFKKDSSLLSLFSASSQPISPFYIFLERNLWFTPQIFLHLLKLIFFPLTLSTYQSNHVHLSNTLFSLYSIFCTLLYVLFLSLPLVLFFVFRKKSFSYVFFLIYAFYFGAFPFLHILLPTYCLSADRYCYMPSFLLILIILSICLPIIKNKKVFIIPALVVLALLTTRTLIRITEWNNPEALYESAYKIDKNPLYKGQKLGIYANHVGSLRKQSLMDSSLQQALGLLNKSIKQFKHLSTSEPLTLKSYGLDGKSLKLKAAYAISVIKNDNYRESPEEILSFFEPYIKDNLDICGINQVILYSELLLKSKEFEKLKDLLEYGYKRFPHSRDILFSLSNYYKTVEKNNDKAFEILEKLYKFYPNNPKVLHEMLSYYEAKGDLQNHAKFAYLIGLREHSFKAYQLAAKLYLDINNLDFANLSLKKAIRLNSYDPLTLLLTSRYLDLKGDRRKILEILNSALIVSKRLGDKQDLNVTKNILLSLIKVTANQRNITTAKKYLVEFENMKGLTYEDIKQIQEVKRQINISEQNKLRLAIPTAKK